VTSCGAAQVTFAAFDEDTQIKTDRLVRNIIQVTRISPLD
jgi:hypothetical protein